MMQAAPLTGGGDDDDDDDDDGATTVPANSSRGFSGFNRGRTVTATAFKLDPAPEHQRRKVEEYVHGGAMMMDLNYAKMLYGLVGTAVKYEFDYYWESPWIEEHVMEAQRKRRKTEQQRSDAVRTYIKASSAQDVEDADKYMASVKTLLEWDADTNDPRDVIKTISRMVQGFEKRSIRTMMEHQLVKPQGRQSATMQGAGYVLERLRGSDKNGLDIIANSLRRSLYCYDAFASLVACEMRLASARGGSKNTSIHISRCMSTEYQSAVLCMLRILNDSRGKSDLILRDTIGLPLMFMRHNMCLTKDVLVVAEDEKSATYIIVLDGKAKNLDGVETIKIRAMYSDKDAENDDKADREAAAALRRGGANAAAAASSAGSIAGLAT